MCFVAYGRNQAFFYVYTTMHAHVKKTGLAVTSTQRSNISIEHIVTSHATSVHSNVLQQQHYDLGYSSVVGYAINSSKFYSQIEQN